MNLILATAALAAVLASPAFAQAYDPREGTGNVLPFSYGPDSTRHGPGDPLTINSQGGQLADDHSGELLRSLGAQFNVGQIRQQPGKRQSTTFLRRRRLRQRVQRRPEIREGPRRRAWI